jgi:hypothetical protein
MSYEDDVRRYLEVELCTTAEELDPTKPLVVDKDDMLTANPSFDEGLVMQKSREKEIERRKNHLGTSFFLCFDPLCNIHQLAGSTGEVVRHEIVSQLRSIFMEVFEACIPVDISKPTPQFWQILRSEICPYAQPGFNNGEVYLWLRSMLIKEDFVLKVLATLKRSLEENPIKVQIDDEEYVVEFYGWGFRYI